MIGLTPKQADVLNFMIRFVVENHTHATTSELMNAFDFVSRNAASTHISALIKKGYVEYNGCDRKSWRVVKNADGRRIKLGVYVHNQVD